MIIVCGAGSLQDLVIYVGVKEANAFPSALEMIIVDEFARGMIHPIASAQGKSSGHVAFFVIPDFLMFTYKSIYSRPASDTF